MKIGDVTLNGARVMSAGPRFLTTMQIPILAGREIDDRDQPGSTPVAVISERLARTYFGNENPLGRPITFVDEKRDLEIVGVSANVRYGDLKEDESPMTLFVAVSQFSPDGMTTRCALRVIRRAMSEACMRSCARQIHAYPSQTCLRRLRKSIEQSARKLRSRNYARVSRFSLS